MKKVIRLTESDLTRIVRRVLKESSEVIKVKAWRTKEEKANGSARSFNLDTTDHNLMNNMVYFQVRTAGMIQSINGISSIKCGDTSGKMLTELLGKTAYVYVSEEGRKKLTKMCDAYVSNDTKMDGDYA